MITKVTKENKALYKALFEKASNELNIDVVDEEKKIEISSLDEYFAVLKELSETDTGMLYTVLPLDEPTFDIDTNTRIISVPAEFKKNGISVQGDKFSEILYFTVDRYADSMDLFRKDINIEIQWESAPGPDKQTIKKSQKEWIRDITTYAAEGKLIFGWALGPELTKNPGNIKFSVRFYRFDEKGKVDFNLNTLTATATINPSINYEIISQGETSVGPVLDYSETIQDRIANSSTPPGQVPAPTPEFEMNLPTEETHPKEVFKTEANGKIYASVDLNNEGEYTFVAQAYSDEGVISYQWGRKDLNVSEELPYSAITVETVGDRLKTIYVETEDEVISKKYPYYYKSSSVENGAPRDTYSIYTIPQSLLGRPVNEIEEQLYEKRSAFTANEVGDYIVNAVNRYKFATTPKESNPIRIPGPDAESFVLDSHESDINAPVAKYLDENGDMIIETLAKTDQKNDIITYTWTELFVNEDGTYVESEKLATKTAAVTDNVEDFDDTFVIEDVSVEDRAKYNRYIKVAAQATRNKAKTEILDAVYRITAPAQPVRADRTYETLNLSPTGTASMTIDVNRDLVVSDKVEFQWYKVKSSVDTDPSVGDDLPLVGATTQAIIVTLDEAQASDNVFLVGAGGNYYCKVTNHANGDTAITITKPIIVGTI